MYSPKDPRRDYNFTGRLSDGKTEVKVDGYTYYNPNPPKSMVIIAGKDGAEDKTIVHPLYDSETQSYLPISGMQMCAGKFRLCNTDELQHSYQQHALSIPLMRLADVYLMYAEALYYADGDETNARVWMNKVLQRACGDDALLFEQLKTYYHRDEFIEELLEIRERELVFEFSRKWDLIRYNRLFDSIESLDEEKVAEKWANTELDPDDPDYIDPKYLNYQTGGYMKLGIPTIRQNMSKTDAAHKIWLPISEEQRGVNKNLEQNAGW